MSLLSKLPVKPPLSCKLCSLIEGQLLEKRCAEFGERGPVGVKPDGANFSMSEFDNGTFVPVCGDAGMLLGCPKKLRVEADSERNNLGVVVELRAEAREDLLERAVEITVLECSYGSISFKLIGVDNPNMSSLGIGLSGGRSARNEPRVE